jgi:glycosyltransferase involved in cell wall biosynthesis
LNAPAPDAPVLLMLARLVRFKGAHHLVRAASGMSTPHEVWIGGQGPERPRLERLAEELGEPVRFLGWLNGGQLESAFAAASALVVPSLFPETYGLTGPEAALRGLTTVAYLQAGVYDWLRPHDGDIGVAPGDVEALTAALDTVLSRAPRSRTPDRLRPQARDIGELYAAAAGLNRIADA